MRTLESASSAAFRGICFVEKLRTAEDNWDARKDFIELQHLAVIAKT